MKKGTGDDPFATDDPDDVDDQPAVEIDPDVLEADDAIAPNLDDAGDGVPWVYRRANVKERREMVQYYLRDAVQDAEDDLVDAVGEQLGVDVSKTDVREAAVVAAMRDPDAVADELRRWGFEG